MWIKFYGKIIRKWIGILKIVMVYIIKKKYFVYINLYLFYNVWIVVFKLININKIVKWDIMEYMFWIIFIFIFCIYIDKVNVFFICKMINFKILKYIICK